MHVLTLLINCKLCKVKDLVGFPVTGVSVSFEHVGESEDANCSSWHGPSVLTHQQLDHAVLVQGGVFSFSFCLHYSCGSTLFYDMIPRMTKALGHISAM